MFMLELTDSQTDNVINRIALLPKRTGKKHFVPFFCECPMVPATRDFQDIVRPCIASQAEKDWKNVLFICRPQMYIRGYLSP